MKLSSGEVLSAPNVIRVSVNEKIEEQYLAYSEECKVDTLSRSILRRVLTTCSASFSLQGLDNFAADGNKGFDDLLQIVDKLDELGAVDGQLKRKLKEGRNYLKGDYKIHCTPSSDILITAVITR
ncbi:uncharacterized protein LOC116608369 [Nematostella vectensis]|uniref:uncharacterized protein LOC116608369 n=1 Tax=Nematostella vectensis TaxID=45351 RepID=UPI0013905B76|nr:uncharacterized protein LOC116608369 [Nematostella vectensis]